MKQLSHLHLVGIYKKIDVFLRPKLRQKGVNQQQMSCIKHIPPFIVQITINVCVNKDTMQK